MKLKIFGIAAAVLFVFYACDSDDGTITPPSFKENITAKESVDDVKQKAVSDFSVDAELTGIYGRGVAQDGTVNLLVDPSQSAWVYIMQSDSLEENSLFVPVYAAGPIESPISMSDLLVFVQDTTAKDVLGTALDMLSTVSLGDTDFMDSPEALNKVLGRTDVTNFLSGSSDAVIDMYLFPSKAMDSTSVVNAADWVVNFRDSTSSLVLWIVSATGNVQVISQ